MQNHDSDRNKLRKELSAFFQQEPYVELLEQRLLAEKILVYLAHELWYVPEGNTTRWTMGTATEIVNTSVLFHSFRNRIQEVLEAKYFELHQRQVEQAIEAIILELTTVQPVLMQAQNPLTLR